MTHVCAPQHCKNKNGKKTEEIPIKMTLIKFAVESIDKATCDIIQISKKSKRK